MGGRLAPGWSAWELGPSFTFSVVFGVDVAGDFPKQTRHLRDVVGNDLAPFIWLQDNEHSFGRLGDLDRHIVTADVENVVLVVLSEKQC
jgi:hypothetical protein